MIILQNKLEFQLFLTSSNPSINHKLIKKIIYSLLILD